MNIARFYVVINILQQLLALSIPFINNAYLQALSGGITNITTRFNISCDECLCEAINFNMSSAYMALHCFINNDTCQLFHNFPLAYKVKQLVGSKLYFLQNTFPTTSQCCMPNIADLLAALTSSIPNSVSLPFQPASFGYDSLNPNEAVVSAWSGNSLYWFDLSTMTFIQNNSLVTGLTISLYKNQTFTSVTASRSIHVRDIQSLSLMANISFPSLSSVRKIIFLNDGRTMAVTTQNNMSITLFNVDSPSNYSIQQELPFPLIGAHGATKLNESFFYVSTWASRSVGSYKYENGVWNYQLVVNNKLSSSGAHVAVDECGRIWYVDTQYGLRVFDSSGSSIGNWSMSLNASGSNIIHDVLLLPNYVFLVSFVQQRRIVKFDPQLICS